MGFSEDSMQNLIWQFNNTIIGFTCSNAFPELKVDDVLHLKQIYKNGKPGRTQCL
jgi:hypothetical protein